MNKSYPKTLLILLTLTAQPLLAGLLEVQQDALIQNGLTGTADYNLRAQQAASEATRAAAGPQLSWELSTGHHSLDSEINGFTSNLDTSQSRAAIALSQPLLNRENSHAARAAALNADAAAVQLRQERQQVNYRAASGWIELLLNNQLLLVSQKKYQQLVVQQQQVRKLVSEGFIAKIDETEVLLEIERARLQILDAQKNLKIAATTLQQYTAKFYPPLTTADRLESVDMSLFRMEATGAILQAAKDNNHDLQLAELQSLAASETYQSARAAILPKLALVGEYAREFSRKDTDSDSDELSIGLQLKQDLGILGNQQQYRAQAEKYQALLQQQQKSALRAQLETELKQQFAAYEADVRAFFTSRALLDRSGQKVSMVQQAQTLGRRDQRDIYDAIIENYSIRESLVTLLYRALQSRLTIRLQSGTLDDAEMAKLDQQLQRLQAGR